MEKTQKIGIRRTDCLACGAPLGAPVFVSGGFPASAQNIPDAEEKKRDSGIELRLCRCSRCGLYQFDCEPVDYYKKVIRAVGLSPTMQELRRKDYRHLLETYGLTGGKFIECGCGNGDFLKVLKEFPADITGIEADPELAEKARASLKDSCRDESAGEPKILCMFTDTPETDIPGAPFDCFLSFNFLEHQPDPAVMLACMHHNLREGGYGLITVPSFEYILKEARYYELIRDHIANYDLNSLVSLCTRCGFTVLEKGIIGIGDTLRVVVRKMSSRSGTAPEKAIQQEPVPEKSSPDESASGKCSSEESDSARFSPGPGSPEALSLSLMQIRQNVSAMIGGLKAGGKKLALWGAGHQGFTIASTTELGSYAEYIIDSAPFKQGRFAPASHLPIVAPEYFNEAPVDVILVTAPGYVKEISASIRERYGDKAPEIRSILDL